MSMCYCETHDEYFDSDYDEACPMCISKGLAYCYNCQRGYEVKSESETRCSRCGDKLNYEV